MPVTSFSPGRVPESFRFGGLSSQLGRVRAESLKYERQAATGLRVAVGSDDPAAAARGAVAQRQIERNAAVAEQTATADRFLSSTDRGLAAFTDVARRARTLLQTGVGLQASQTEKDALAAEVAALRDGLLLEANRTDAARGLFGGTGPDAPPFEHLGGGRVLYTGDVSGVPELSAGGPAVRSAVDGHAALSVLTPARVTAAAPALTDSTPLAALHGGAGVEPGELTVTLDDGAGGAATYTIDFTGSRTVGDIKARLEAAFGAGPPAAAVGYTPQGGLTVGVAAAGGPAASATVTDVPGGRFARQLGLVGAPPTVPAGGVTGAALGPAVTRFTPLAALNGGAGMDPSGGVRITQGEYAVDVDLSAATTVGEALTAITQQAEAAGVYVLAEVAEGGAGLSVRGRVSGADFTIGEAGGTTAGDLGVRTFAASTPLSDLSGGAGVPTAEPLVLTRRDGTDVAVDLSAAATVGDVLAALNAVDPGVLVASFNTEGNGITLSDSFAAVAPAVTGPLAVADSDVAAALGLGGSAAPGDDLPGREVNPTRAAGLPDLLARLETALRAGDDAALTRLGDPLDAEVDRLAGVRAEVGTRQRRLADRQTRLLDEELALRETLSDLLDADLADAFTQITALQTAYEATLRLTSQTAELSLVNFL